MKSTVAEIIDWLKGVKCGCSARDKLVLLVYIISAVIVITFIVGLYGKERAAKIILKRPNLVNWLPAGNILVKIDGIFLSLPVMIDYMVFVKEDWEKKEREFASNLVSDNGSILDIGANAGHYTAFLAKKNPKSKIISVEASENIFNILKENCELNKLENVSLYNLAVSDEDDELLDFFERESLSTTQKEHLEFWHVPLEQIRRTQVKTITIDSLIKKENLDKVILLKIDIEGAEVLALKGASSALQEKKIKNMIIEYHTPQNKILIEKMLKDLGYSILVDPRSIFFESKDIAIGHIIATKELNQSSMQ